MNQERFWTKSYDEGLEDLDPARWEVCYTDLLEPVFRDFPDKTALYFMGVEVSYKDLNRYSSRFANMLRSFGLEKGDVVGINLPNIPEYVIAALGAYRAGCVVSGVSPLLSAEEMAYQLKDSDARCLVTLDAIFAGRLAGIADQLPGLKVVTTASVGGFLPGIKRFLGKLLGKIPKGKVTELAGKTVNDFTRVIRSDTYSTRAPEVDLTPDDLSCLQYTGGTTGDPKGAMLSHRNLVCDILLIQHWFGWERGVGTILSGFPFFHIAGLQIMVNSISLGWSLILIPNPRDTDHICGELEKYKPEVMVNVPSLYQLLVADPKFRTLDHTNLKTCISAAAAYPEESQKELGNIVGKGKLLEGYGMTETSPITTFNPSNGPKKLGSIGLPITNTDLKLVDPGTGKTVDRGLPGEICVKGDMVMVGYHNKPEQTAQVIDADGYMHTGDVAVQDDAGYLRIVDRTKDMIIVGGFKVFSKKVEDIMTGHPAVDMMAIVGLPNPDRPGSELVKAFIRITPEYDYGGDKDALKKELTDFAREKLAPYEVPKIIEWLEEMPLTTVGKIDKKVLRAMASK
ncbi:MAG: AMP-dependent synthetase [Deltaproteobacteria bacterium]|nr:MAG: AMP-dependent synthetase [Deltaproteobacteria bacterium]